MKRFAFASVGLAGVLGVAFALSIAGCSQPTTSDANSTTAAPGSAPDQAQHSDGHADHQHGGMADMEKGLAKLSAEDRASAMKQHVCPVSDEMLGTMGAPIKVKANGKEAWICCNGCKEQFEADPEKYLAKMKGHDGHQGH